MNERTVFNLLLFMSERWLRGLGRMLPNLKEARSKPQRGRSFSLSLTLIKWDPVVAAG